MWKLPESIFEGVPCSACAVGSALHIKDAADISDLLSPRLQKEGYLSLKDMDVLIRDNLEVKKKEYFRRDERVPLWIFLFRHGGEKAIICVLGHYIYFDGRDYYSFMSNDYDMVVQVWFLE